MGKLVGVQEVRLFYYRIGGVGGSLFGFEGEEWEYRRNVNNWTLCYKLICCWWAFLLSSKAKKFLFFFCPGRGKRLCFCCAF